MKVELGYLAFTALSILIQFCVMDYVQEKLQIDNQTTDLNNTSQRKRLDDVLKEFSKRPHALYYRMVNKKALGKSISLLNTYNNSTIPDISIETTTILSSSIFDLLYDENTSVTDIDDLSTTESLFTTTEFDNITDNNLLDKKNKSNVKPFVSPKMSLSEQCHCNLLFQVCDINCCCDGDCTEAERNVFGRCIESEGKDDNREPTCLSFDSVFNVSGGHGLFCLVKTNLPDKRNVNHYKSVHSQSNRYYKWHSNSKVRAVEKFSRKMYSFGDLIWILKNGSISYADLPSLHVNNYCNGRNPIKFLEDKGIQCEAKLKDLEIFHIVDNFIDSSVISITENSLNTSAWNCSALHCTNWTILICDKSICTTYNRSLHEPLCTGNTCNHIAPRVDYIFHYHDSKITNATLKLYSEKNYLNIPFLSQKINVNFIIANKSTDNIVQLSGNPGYIIGYPVIASTAESNYTNNFFNTTLKKTSYLQYIENKKGSCMISNSTANYVLFGSNLRIKCRYTRQNIDVKNYKTVCSLIQNDIKTLFGLTKKTVLSPYGNPQVLTDDEWITLQEGIEEQVFAEFDVEKSSLKCYNLITRMSLVFTYADVSELVNKRVNKILTASLDVSRRNITMSVEDLSTVITFDTVFLDVTRPSFYQYAGAPHLNIHLPGDFFFPFPLNRGSFYRNNENSMVTYKATFYCQQPSPEESPTKQLERLLQPNYCKLLKSCSSSVTQSNRTFATKKLR